MGFEDTNLLDLDVHVDDPEPLYEWLREEQPVFWDPHNELWAVSRYEDVVYVSRHPELFCSGMGAVPNVDVDIWPDMAMINLDGQAHTCQRKLVSRGLSAVNVGRLEDFTRQTIVELIDGFVSKGQADLVTDFARPLPMRIMGHLFNYPREKEADVLDWTDVYVNGGCGPEYITDEVVEAFGNFIEWHEEIIAQRIEERGDDMLSMWLDAEIDGERLDEERILYEHNLMLVGGSETTRHAISGGMAELLRNPEQLQFLRDNPEGIPNAVEEMIRWTTPFVRMRRTLTEDTELRGVALKEGQQIVMLYPAANRDPRIWDRPQVFDIQRSFDKPSLSFGFGKHYCLGAPLARLEMRISIKELLDRLPSLALNSESPPLKGRSCFLRGLTNLPIVF